MKRTLALLLVLAQVICLLLFTGCSKTSDNPSTPSASTTEATDHDADSTTDVNNTTDKDTDSNQSATQRKEATNLKLTESVLERAIVNEGNLARIATVLKKAEQGYPVKIGVIGGSITQGFAASAQKNQYAEKIKQWWAETFPSSIITLVNAGIGATDSLIGVHRAQNDLFSAEPDLVIVEFAVNDAADYLHWETYEGLVRQALKQENTPAVMLLFMMNSDGISAQYLQQEVGEKYDLPMISYRNALWPSGGTKLYSWSQLSPDTVHPNDTGHAIVSELFIYYFNKVRTKLSTVSTTIDSIPEPLTANGYEKANLLNNKNLTPTSLGSFSVDNRAFYQFPNGWSADGNEKPIVFTISNAKNIHLLYRMTAEFSDHAAKATVKVNGKLVGTIDCSFANGWGDYAATFPLITGTTQEDYTVEIQVISESPKTFFAIMGFLVS